MARTLIGRLVNQHRFRADDRPGLVIDEEYSAGERRLKVQWERGAVRWVELSEVYVLSHAALKHIACWRLEENFGPYTDHTKRLRRYCLHGE